MQPPQHDRRFRDGGPAAGVTTIDIDPGIREAEMRKAFVAMPFGEKTYKRRKVDCDATFAKVIVPVLEDADLASAAANPKMTWSGQRRERPRGKPNLTT